MQTADKPIAETAITSSGNQVRLERIALYPLKSARGLFPATSPVDRLGLAWDRRWVVALPAGEALTQREEPRLALIAPALSDDCLTLTAPGLPPLAVPLAVSATADLATIVVLQARLTAARVSAAADAWVSRFLGYPARLMRVHEERVVDPVYAVSASDRTGFADAFPFLILGQGSLDDLNTRLPRPLAMDRFRPNLVFAGAPPFAEDHWRRIRVGDLELALVKPCARCVVTTTDQLTGERSDEPLRTLATYRRAENGKVMFGQNAVHLGTGTLRVGDVVSVLARR